MSTLLMRLAAPLQSWGVDSKFERRNAGRFPSKSGVIGMCAAAFGYSRYNEEGLEKLVNLKFGVRIDKCGTLLKDFHMAHEEMFWSTDDRRRINQMLPQDKKNKASYLTTRYYLADAAFLVGLEGDDRIIHDIDNALRYPMFPLYLGRRSCPPEGRVSLGIVPDALHNALEKHPPLTGLDANRSAFEKMRIIMDAESIEVDKQRGSYSLHDNPRSFSPVHRKHDFRSVCEIDITATQTIVDYDALSAVEEVSPCT